MRRKAKLFQPVSFGSIAIAAAAAGVLLPVSAARAENTYNIMAVGDSITAGFENNPSWAGTPYSFGYRGDLYGDLATDTASGTGAAFTYVGISQEPLNGESGTPTVTTNPAIPNLIALGEDNHEGYGGTTTSFLLSHIQDEIAYNNPNVILLMIGINDIGEGSSTNPTGTETNLAAIMQSVFTHAPNADLIVAQITPYTESTPAIVDYNSFIRTTVATDAALGDHVSTVNQYANFQNSDGSINTSLYANGINHPDDAGYALMATTWYNGIKALNLPVTGPATPNPTPPVNLVSNGNFELHAGAGNSHNVDPAGQGGWIFTQGANNGTGSGIDTGPSGPYGTNFSSYNGEQMGFLQGSGNSTITSMSQVINGLVPGTQYTLSFESKGIAGFTGADPFHVEMDGSVTTKLFGGAYISPALTNPNDPSGYTAYSTVFTATDASETLMFADAGDPVVTQVSWIDAVSISAVPEPGMASLLTAAAAALLLRRRRPYRSGAAGGNA